MCRYVWFYMEKIQFIVVVQSQNGLPKGFLLKEIWMMFAWKGCYGIMKLEICRIYCVL